MEWIIVTILGIMVLLLLLCAYLIYVNFRSLENINNSLPKSRIEQDITNIKGNVRKTLPRTNYIYTKDTQLTEMIRIMEEIYTIKMDMKSIEARIANLEENVAEGLSHGKKAKDKDKDNQAEDKDKEKNKTAS